MLLFYYILCYHPCLPVLQPSFLTLVSSDLECGWHIEARLENSDKVCFLDNHLISKDALDLFRFLVEKSDWAFVGEADRRAESVAYRGPDETEQILRGRGDLRPDARSEEHTSELQSLKRIS